MECSGTITARCSLALSGSKTGPHYVAQPRTPGVVQRGLLDLKGWQVLTWPQVDLEMPSQSQGPEPGALGIYLVLYPTVAKLVPEPQDTVLPSLPSAFLKQESPPMVTTAPGPQQELPDYGQCSLKAHGICSSRPMYEAQPECVYPREQTSKVYIGSSCETWQGRHRLVPATQRARVLFQKFTTELGLNFKY
ncbi:hypothetical protein AAY473_034920 [Plecturocebus cupreus]